MTFPSIAARSLKGHRATGYRSESRFQLHSSHALLSFAVMGSHTSFRCRTSPSRPYTWSQRLID